jgi:ATP-dependent helicase/nuclease subunit A
VEAGLPVDFEVLEDGAQKRLLKEIQNDLLVHVEGPLATYLGTLLDELGEHGWDDLTSLVITHWHRLEALVEGKGLAAVLAKLEQELGLAGREDAGQPLVPTPAEWAALRTVVAALPEQSAREVLEAPEALREAAWKGFLLTGTNTPRARLFVKAELAVLDETDVAVLNAAALRVAEQVKLRRVYRGFDVTRAALLWAAAVRGAYVQRKHRDGMVDYADLLDGLERVLKASETGGEGGLSEWVWYGLDRRFRHLVVDEAQDNNRQQDRIVQWLAKSILSGDVGEGAARTVLAVGDMKQSIFRFQGAVPELFVKLREVLRDWAPVMREVDLVHSFRSGKQVLALVDRVFAQGDSGAVVVGSDFRDWPNHAAVAAARASRVELWPTVVLDGKDTVEPWALPEVRAAAGGHGEDMACLRAVGAWLQQQVGRVVMPSTSEALRYDDVMLVVQRNRIAALAAGVLRGMGIPVASGGGVQPLVVDDAVACVRVIYNPEDNLALAHVLKGVRRWTDAQLLELAEKGTRNQEPGTREEPLPWCHGLEGEDRAWLLELHGMAWEAPLKVVQRVVREVRGDESQLECLLLWAEQCATLRELVARLELDDLPVSGTGSGVRILTVHGSKGLQAPLVILPDTMAALADVSHDTLLWGEDVVLFKQAKGLSVLEDALAEAESARRKADSLRGLYVACTRAMDWLVVTGFGEVKESSDTWWTRVREGTRNQGTEEPGGIWWCGDTFAVTEARVEAAVVETVVPAWASTAVEILPAVVQSAEQARGERVHARLQGLKVPVEADVEAEVVRVKEALPWLWAAGSRSEMAVAVEGRVGRIDRLVEHDGALWVIDFKTGQIPDTVPPAYVQQLQGYVRALRTTYPQRTLRAAIVWTAAPRVDEVALEC